MQVFTFQQLRFFAVLAAFFCFQSVFGQYQVEYSDTPLVGERGVAGIFKCIPKVCIADPTQSFDSLRRKLQPGERKRVTVDVAVDITMENSGQWKETKTHRIWIVEIVGERADQIGLKFEDIYLPENAKLYYYSSDRKYLAKPSPKNVNNYRQTGNKVSLPAISPNAKVPSVILEYHEPLGTDYPRRIFQIGKISYTKFPDTASIYRDAEEESCETDISCPQGICWHNESNGIANIRVDLPGIDAGNGTGALLNTVRDSESPKLYVYTARHVIGNAQAENILVDFRFRLNGM